MECSKMSMWLLAVWSFILIKCSSGNTWKKYRIRENCKIKSKFVMQNDSFDSPSACLVACKELVTGCISVSWNSQTTSCLFSSRDTTSDLIGIYRPYEQAAGWMCASQCIYPVFGLLKTTYTNSLESMTFEEASGRCAEHGTSLASDDDVITAQNLGFNFCRCSWLSGGGNAVIRKPGSNCMSDISTEPVLWCNYTLADAWCKN